MTEGRGNREGKGKVEDKVGAGEPGEIPIRDFSLASLVTIGYRPLVGGCTPFGLLRWHHRWIRIMPKVNAHEDHISWI